MKNKIKNISFLIDLYNEGIPVYKLCNEFKMSSNKIRNILKRNNIHIRNLSESHFKRINTVCDYCKKHIEKILCNYKKSKHHFCNSKCSSSYHCDENNGRYIDGRSFFEQSIWKLTTYKQWRRIVFERDAFTCQLCYKKKIYIEAHHKIPILHIIELFQLKTAKEALKCNFLWDTNNGITLCKKCHNKVHPEKGYIKESEE